MLAFPEMIAPAASEAGIKLPPDIEKFDRRVSSLAGVLPYATWSTNA